MNTLNASAPTRTVNPSERNSLAVVMVISLDVMNSVGRHRGVRIEKRGRLACERLVELKQPAVAGVRINEQHCVGQVLTQPIRVTYRDHFIVYAVHDEGRVVDALQIRESIA